MGRHQGRSGSYVRAPERAREQPAIRLRPRCVVPAHRQNGPCQRHERGWGITVKCADLAPLEHLRDRWQSCRESPRPRSPPTTLRCRAGSRTPRWQSRGAHSGGRGSWSSLCPRESNFPSGQGATWRLDAITTPSTKPDQTLLAKRSSGRGRVRSRVLSHGRTVVEVSTRRPLILNLSVGPWIPLSRR